jgi:hypothetical protein
MDAARAELFKIVCEAIEERVREKLPVEKCEWMATSHGLDYVCPVFHLVDGTIIVRLDVMDMGSTATVWALGDITMPMCGHPLGLINNGEPLTQRDLAAVYKAQQKLGTDNVAHLDQVEREFKEYLIPNRYQIAPRANYSIVKIVKVVTEEYSV